MMKQICEQFKIKHHNSAPYRPKMNGAIEAANRHGVGSSSTDRGKRAKVLEPKRCEGARDAKEIENFMFDMEQYFWAVRTDSEEDKVAMAAMYLVGDAKLWWRSKFVNDECPIKTWGDLKRELKGQFFLENVEYNARRKRICKRILYLDVGYKGHV